MAEQTRESKQVGSVQATDQGQRQDSPVAESGNESALERIEALVTGAEAWNDIEADGLNAKLDELAVTTEEELDALRINLLQEDERYNARDGSGRVVDEVAEERITRFTESAPMQGDLGAVSVEPGRDDTSSVLRRHHPKSSPAPADAVAERNLDEPMDERIAESKTDEETSG